MKRGNATIFDNCIIVTANLTWDCLNFLNKTKHESSKLNKQLSWFKKGARDDLKSLNSVNR